MTCAKSSNGPLVVECVGGGDVDSLDFEVLQKCLIRAIHVWDAMLSSKLLGLGLITS